MRLRCDRSVSDSGKGLLRRAESRLRISHSVFGSFHSPGCARQLLGHLWEHFGPNLHFTDSASGGQWSPFISSSLPSCPAGLGLSPTQTCQLWMVNKSFCGVLAGPGRGGKRNTRQGQRILWASDPKNSIYKSE